MEKGQAPEGVELSIGDEVFYFSLFRTSSPHNESGEEATVVSIDPLIVNTSRGIKHVGVGGMVFPKPDGDAQTTVSAIANFVLGSFFGFIMLISLLCVIHILETL